MRVAVVILNFNGEKFLEKFLPSVIKYSEGAHIYVADNNSSDNSVAVVKQKFPSVSVIELEENTGFAGGYNNALRHVKEEIYCLLNSDVEVSEGWLDAPSDYLHENEKQVACQPKILAYHRPTHFEHAGAAGGFIDKWGFPFCRGRIMHIAEEDNGQYDDTCEVFWATGACLFIKAEVFWKVKGFDADFFAHMEEIDLCWRLKNAGYTIGYVSGSKVFHVGGGTLDTTNPKKTYLNFRNGLALMYKNLPKNKLIGVMLFRMILDGIAGFKFLLEGKPKHCWSVFIAHIHFYKWVKKLRKMRRISQFYATKFLHPQMYQKSLIWQFFIRKKHTFKALNQKGWK